MKVQTIVAIVKHLIRDTFRQARASGIIWIVLVVTAICVVLCLSVSVADDVPLHGGDEPVLFLPRTSPQMIVPSVVSVLASSGPLDYLSLISASRKVWFGLEANPGAARREGIETIGGQVTLLFGLVSVPVSRERGDSVRFIELLLSGGIAGTCGLLLALTWTAGFVPTFLEPHAASILLAKPIARSSLLLGKYLSVVTFAGLLIGLFVLLTWLSLGVRTNVWDTTYLWCIPLVLLQFAIFFSFSVLLAVVTRSTVACVLGSILYWLLAWGINYSQAMTLDKSESQSMSSFTRGFAEGAYWVSPKPIDAGLILFNTLDAHHHFEKPKVFQIIESDESFSPQLSILSSFLIAFVLLAVSTHEFNKTDY